MQAPVGAASVRCPGPVWPLGAEARAGSGPDQACAQLTHGAPASPPSDAPMVVTRRKRPPSPLPRAVANAVWCRHGDKRGTALGGAYTERPYRFGASWVNSVALR